MSTPDPLVEVENLGKRFDGRWVVTDVTLTLRPGEIIGLVGANGGGKTTTLRMLAGLLRPDGGGGQVLGADIAATSTARRRSTGYMGQRLALYADLTVAENLRFHADARGIQRPVVAVADAVASYGLSPVLKTRFGALSGGWARRVQFSATVLHAPPLLLLDEPTAGLDVITRRDIWDSITGLAATGHGVIVSTHDLQEAARCSHVLLFDNGHAAPQTTPAALTASRGASTLEEAVARSALAP